MHGVRTYTVHVDVRVHVHMYVYARNGHSALWYMYTAERFSVYVILTVTRQPISFTLSRALPGCALCHGLISRNYANGTISRFLGPDCSARRLLGGPNEWVMRGGWPG